MQRCLGTDTSPNHGWLKVAGLRETMQEWVGGSPEAPPRVSWCLGARETERPGGENEGESALSHFAPLRFQILTPGNPQQGLRAERLGGPRRLERTGPGWGGRDRRRTAQAPHRPAPGGSCLAWNPRPGSSRLALHSALQSILFYCDCVRLAIAVSSTLVVFKGKDERFLIRIPVRALV